MPYLQSSLDCESWSDLTYVRNKLPLINIFIVKLYLILISINYYLLHIIKLYRKQDSCEVNEIHTIVSMVCENKT